jgi:hypothetical protein
MATLTRMYQRRGTATQWANVANSVILQAGEIGLETDTGKFKIGNGQSLWSALSYYLKDSDNSSLYVKLNPIAPGYNQTITGINLFVPQSSSQIPLVVSGVSGQSAVLQRWRSNTDATLASIDQAGKLTATGALFNAEVDVNNNKIVNLNTPTADTDAANKVYVDNAIAGLSWKEAVHLIAHGAGSNVALTGTTGTLVIDSHAPLVQADSGLYRLLLTGQTTASQNGIYLYTDNGTTYTLTRTTDADTPAELHGASVYVQEGTLYGTSSWVQSNYDMTTFAQQTWVQFSGAALITAGTGMTKDGNKLDVVGTANRITANADSIDIASTYVGQTSITTLGTVETGTWSASTIAANRGGTGQTSYAVGDILFADTTATLAKRSAGSVNLPLLSGGAGVAPNYGQIVTASIADSSSTTTGVTYAKLQYLSAQYRILGRISSGAGIAQELTPDNIITVIGQGSTTISFNRLPVSTSGGNNGTASTLARSDHTHTINDLSDVIITGTPVVREVIKFNGTSWVNEVPSGGISVGATPPSQPAAGDAWFDSNDGSLYVWYDDGVDNDGAGPGTSAQWVQVKSNSALEASILTRLSAVESRTTKLEGANAIRVLSMAERDSAFPSPVQGNTVFRADLGYEQKYFESFNAVTVPDGTTGTPGWYEVKSEKSAREIAHLAASNPANGIHAVNRRDATTSTALSSGTIQLTHFTPMVDLNITTLTFQSTGISSTKPTLVKYAIYQLNANETSMTLIGVTENISAPATSPWMGNSQQAGTLTTSTGFSVPLKLIAGQRYAVAMLVVGNTGGQFMSTPATPGGSGTANFLPILATSFASQTDIPSTLTVSSGTRRWDGPWALLT